MLMDPMGGIVMTNDGNAILREITVQHPAAKHLIEIARSQDEEVGDGTTSVVILAGEMLAIAEQFLEGKMHPVVIIQAYRQALEDAIEVLKEQSFEVDLNDVFVDADTNRDGLVSKASFSKLIDAAASMP